MRKGYEYDSTFDEYYTDIEKACIELVKRRSHSELAEKIARETNLTEAMRTMLDRPALLMFRQVASPLTETIHFFKLAKKHNLKPVILEFYDDKFVSKGNAFKRGLGKLPVHQFLNKKQSTIFEYRTIVDFNTYVGKHLHEVRTITGESLIDLHHEMCAEFLPAYPLQECAIDASGWFHSFGHGANEYYTPLMKLFIKDAILMEIFITTEEEERFSKEIAFPAFKAVESEFNLNPLIVRTVPKEDEQDPFWDCYPYKADAFLKKKGYIE